MKNDGKWCLTEYEIQENDWEPFIPSQWSPGRSLSPWARAWPFVRRPQCARCAGTHARCARPPTAASRTASPPAPCLVSARPAHLSERCNIFFHISFTAGLKAPQRTPPQPVRRITIAICTRFFRKYPNLRFLVFFLILYSRQADYLFPPATILINIFLVLNRLISIIDNFRDQ